MSLYMISVGEVIWFFRWGYVERKLYFYVEHPFPWCGENTGGTAKCVIRIKRTLDRLQDRENHLAGIRNKIQKRDNNQFKSSCRIETTQSPVPTEGRVFDLLWKKSSLPSVHPPGPHSWIAIKYPKRNKGEHLGQEEMENILLKYLSRIRARG